MISFCLDVFVQSFYPVAIININGGGGGRSGRRGWPKGCGYNLDLESCCHLDGQQMPIDVIR